MAGASLCPVLDSNQHNLAITTPSRWRVYQFRQLGNKKNEVSNILKLQRLFKQIRQFTTSLHNQHGIAIAQKSIALFHRFLINLRHELMVRIGTRHHIQRRLRLM